MLYEVLENRRRLGNVGDKIKLKADHAALYMGMGLVKEVETKEKANDEPINEGTDIN